MGLVFKLSGRQSGGGGTRLTALSRHKQDPSPILRTKCPRMAPTTSLHGACAHVQAWRKHAWQGQEWQGLPENGGRAGTRGGRARTQYPVVMRRGFGGRGGQGGGRGRAAIQQGRKRNGRPLEGHATHRPAQSPAASKQKSGWYLLVLQFLPHVISMSKQSVSQVMMKSVLLTK